MRTKFSFINGTTASIVLIKEKRPKKSWRVYRKKKKKVKDLLMQDLNVWKEICEGILT